MSIDEQQASSHVLVSATATAGLAMAVGLIPWSAHAQGSTTSNSSGGGTAVAAQDPSALPEVRVRARTARTQKRARVTPRSGAVAPPAPSAASGTGTPIAGGAGVSGNTNNASIGISRMPGTVRDTPQIVTVIPQEIIRQQQASTLEQILYNVPGITMATGEGNGGLNGDQFRMRGISAKGDIYVDGLRDFGAYKRDAFNTQSVDVIKGPTGEVFGVGNLGGLINQTSKKAHLGTVTNVDQNVASGTAYRTTVDSNIQIDRTTALRINGMYQGGHMADRDNIKDERYGAAFDLGMGLGTNTVWHLGYSYLHRNSTPDYGQSMAPGADGIYRPLLEYGVPGFDRSTSYARSLDRDKTNTHMMTSNFSWDVGNGITVSNDTRVSIYDRDFASTVPGGVTFAGLQSLLRGQNIAMTYGAGGGLAFMQNGFGVQNVLSAKSDFVLGGFRHRTVAGLDLSYQKDERNLGTWVGRVNNQTVVNPNPEMTPGAYLTYPGNLRNANSSNVGLIVSDRMWLTDQFSVQAGVRWDHFSSTFSTTNTAIGGTADAEKFSPQASLIWEPTKDYMVYTSFARSYRPVGTDIAVAVGGNQSEVPGPVGAEPERADSYELGTKLNFLGGRLGLTGAIFQIEKSNSYTVDPDTGEVVVGFSDNGEGVRIRGVEIGTTGKLTPYWNLMLGYSYLDGRVTYSSTAANIGNAATGVPHHNFTLWTTYDIVPSVVMWPGVVTVGGGVQYASSFWTNSANTGMIPETFSLDGMIGYKQDNFRVSLNLYNLTDHRNYQSYQTTGRAVPRSGRTFLVNVGTTF